MRTVRDEITDATATLDLLSDEFSAVPDDQADVLVKSFLAHFTGGLDCRWWWEHFTHVTSAVRFDDGKGFERLLAIVPDVNERVWFVAEDDQLPCYPVFDATSAATQRVIGECFGFEYYLIAKDLSWLLCENHHNYLIAIGDQVRGRLERL